ncbi:MAG: nodulation protein NfeD [Chloroflexi bacterium]|nr:nodulation protein NfeD [Chloroflexota bacterium]
MRRRIFRLVYLSLIALGLFLSVYPTAGIAKAPRIDIVHVDGIIVPVVGDYIERSVHNAENDGSAAVIIELSTPGGAYDTTQEIVETILNSKVPVIVYVSPTGGWAGSAGAFITISAHVAAMAPGSRIGAAHPVTPGTELTPTMQEKITEDAAAFMRSIAALRGRDLELAESAVRQSRSFSVDEAIKGKLVDIRANDMADLLAQIDDRTIKLSSGQSVVLDTSGAELREAPMNTIESFLQMISNPNIAYILLALGGLGLIAELFNPGMIFPGIIGATCLLLGFYALGMLNAYWGGILLILLAFGLLIADVFVTSHGILTAGGLATLVLGSLILFNGSPASIQVSRSLIAGVVIAFGLFFFFIVAAAIRGQKSKAVTGREGLEGQVGVAATPLNPEGMVAVEGERWAAEAIDGNVEPGQEVIVSRIEGLKLFVTKKQE